MRPTWLALAGLIIGSLFFHPSAAAAQEAAASAHADTIRGRVTTDSGAVLPGVDVTVTIAPDRSVRTTRTDSSGQYAIAIANGSGDYLVHILAVGRVTFRRRVTRATGASDSVFVVDAQLKSSVAVLEAVRVRAAPSPKPAREKGVAAETGSSEKLADGVAGAIAPDQAGNIAALAATVPGVSPAQNGFSVLGLGAGQNNTTVNGLAFPGADIPRDLYVRTRVSTSTYDPSRGGFSGGQSALEIAPGSPFSSRRARATLDAPWLQLTDPLVSQAAGRVSGVQLSAGASGSLVEDKLFYNGAVQAGRERSTPISLLNADPRSFARAGVAPDSAARLVELLSQAGIPLSVADVQPSRENVSFLARLDHTPEARRTWGLLLYSKLSRAPALASVATATPGRGGETNSAIGQLQGLYSFYFGDNYLNETRSALTNTRNQTIPYLQLPDGRVLVYSDISDGAPSVASLQFGGSGAIGPEQKSWSWETTNETMWYPRRGAHRVKLAAQFRRDGYQELSRANSLGTFAFNSLADLAANQPSSFSRTLGDTEQRGGEWSGALSIGDYWRKSPTLQLLYGARLEGNRYTAAPAFNPAVLSTFGARTDAAPNRAHVSPRLGFT